MLIVSGCRKEKNEHHFAWLLIALLVCRTLIHVCDCFSLVFVWHLSFIFSQAGGAIYNSNSVDLYISGGDLKFEGSATFTSCSAEASISSSSYARAYAVSGSE